MNELHLYAGAGGGCLASKWLLGHRIVGYVEKEKYCQDVLRARIRDGLLDDAPIFDDVRTFDGKRYRGKVDCIAGGFPCQSFSIIGRRDGGRGESNLWPETIRVIREVQPRWCFLENSPNLLANEYFGTILSELSEAGFNARWQVLSAAELGAPHIRARLWLVAYSNIKQWRAKRDSAHGDLWQTWNQFGRFSWWQSEPAICRVDARTPGSVDRTRCLGNLQIPIVAALAFRLLAGSELE